MELKIISDLNGTYSTTKLDAKLALNKKKQAVDSLFYSVVVENANKRQANASTLTKAEVRGGGKKPYRQKHTGRARQGSIRNPHYVGGGRAFGPTNEKNYKLKQNKKSYQLALKQALVLKLEKEQIVLIDKKVEFKKPSTKDFSKFLEKAKLAAEKNLLFVLKETDFNFEKSANNLENCTTKLFNQVSVKDVLKSTKLVFEKVAFESFIGGIK